MKEGALLDVVSRAPAHRSAAERLRSSFAFPCLIWNASSLEGVIGQAAFLSMTHATLVLLCVEK